MGYMKQMIHTPQFKVNELKQFLKATKRPDERDRARAILKLIEGKKRQEVADFFDISLTTLGEWQQKFKQRGAEGLRTKPQQGNRYKLSRVEKQAIKLIINEKTPAELGLKGIFWTVPLLRAYVRQAYQVTYQSVNTYRELFKFCGFSYHKPDKINKRQNPHMRKRFEDTLKKSSNGTVEKIVWYW